MTRESDETFAPPETEPPNVPSAGVENQGSTSIYQVGDQAWEAAGYKVMFQFETSFRMLPSARLNVLDLLHFTYEIDPDGNGDLIRVRLNESSVGFLQTEIKNDLGPIMRLNKFKFCATVMSVSPASRMADIAAFVIGNNSENPMAVEALFRSLKSPVFHHAFEPLENM